MSPVPKQMHYTAPEINHSCWHFNKQLLWNSTENKHGPGPNLSERGPQVRKGPALEKTDLDAVFNQILPKTSACGMTADISGEWSDRMAQIWPVASCPDDLHLGWLDLSCD